MADPETEAGLRQGETETPQTGMESPQTEMELWQTETGLRETRADLRSFRERFGLIAANPESL
jgi:hypothetical protein